MTSRPGSRRDGLIPLADRIRWTALLRIGLSLAPVALWYLQPASTVDTASAVVVPAVVHLALGVASIGLERLPRRAARIGLSVGLLADGLYLAWAFHALGGLDGGGVFLVLLHTMGMTLLMSFRSGLKVALWHSLLALCVLEIEANEAFAWLVPGPPVAFPVLGFTVYLGALWGSALTTATFASVNERELRRRRYDAEALRRLGLELETCYDTGRIMELLAEFGREELLADRVVVLLQSGEPHEEAFDGSVHQPSRHRSGLVVLDREGPPVPRTAPDVLDAGSLVHEAHGRRETLRVLGLGEPDEAWLGELLPRAQNLAILPLVVDDPQFGAAVLEYGPPSRWRRTRRLERRLLATAEQATAQAGLAMSRAMLMGRLQDAAQTDGLTQIANRTMFDQSLTRECDRALRSGEPLGVVLIDLDHFKILNDTNGHLEGDAALRDVARVLRAVCRQSDLPARYGGEEFAVLLVGARASEAAVAAERFREAIEGLDRRVPVTASLGVASWPEHGITERELMSAADDALYAAKHGGRNRVEIGEVRYARPGGVTDLESAVG